MNKEIVIAAYDKSLNWVDDINPEIKKTIYRKGDVLPLKDNEIKITPNKGRCVHTFFNHIYLNYENLNILALDKSHTIDIFLQRHE